MSVFRKVFGCFGSGKHGALYNPGDAVPHVGPNVEPTVRGWQQFASLQPFTRENAPSTQKTLKDIVRRVDAGTASREVGVLQAASVQPVQSALTSARIQGALQEMGERIKPQPGYPGAGMPLSQTETVRLKAGMELARCRGQLQNWLDASPDNERAGRNTAVERIRRAIKQAKSVSQPVQLDLRNLGLKSIPPIPPGIKALKLSRNNLTSVAGLQNLPALKSLDLSRNAIRSIDELPQLDNLEYLDLGHNQIRSISRDRHAQQPRLQRVFLEDNPLSEDTLFDLVHSHLFRGSMALFDMGEVELDNEGPADIGTEIGRWFEGEAEQKARRDKWSKFAGEPGLVAFAALLRRMHHSAVFAGGQRARSVNSLKKIISLAESSVKYREHCFNLSVGADEACVDNALGVFQDIVRHSENPVFQSDPSVEKTIQYYRGRRLDELVHQFVATNFPNGDAQERRLYLLKKLSPEFGVPTSVSDMSHEPVGKLNESELGKAREHLQAGMSMQKLAEYLCDEDGWKQMPASEFPQEFETHNAQWQTLLDEGPRLERTFEVGEEDRIASDYESLGKSGNLTAQEAVELAQQLPRGGKGTAFAMLEKAARRDLEHRLTHRLVSTKANL